MCKRCVRLIEALEETKIYINLDGTSKPRKRKEDVLKFIRHALSPKSGQDIVEELNRLRKMEEAIYNKYSRGLYWGMWKILGNNEYAEHKKELRDIVSDISHEMDKIF